MKQKISSFFKIEARQSSFQTELLAGLSTFLSMAYIVSLHPQILSQTGMPFSASATATVLVCFFSSLAMGLYANSPIVMGPGMSLSSFFTFTLVQSQGVPYQLALGATFWVGVVFFVLSLFKVREKLALSVPSSLKSGLVCGIGLFVAFVGLKEGQLIVHSTETFLKAKEFTPENSIFLIGLALTFILLVLKIKGSLLLSIALVTLLSFPLGRVLGEKTLLNYQGLFAMPDFSALAQMDLKGALNYSAWPVLFSIAFVDLFESLGSVLGITRATARSASTQSVGHDGAPISARDSIPSTQSVGHDGAPISARDSIPSTQSLKKILLVDATATAGAGLFGSSSVICFLESLVGLHAGGKTGLTALTTAFLFLPFLFLSPLLSMIPHIATAPVLVALGAYMMKSAKDIEWGHLEEALPAFMMILLIPLCFSIIQGIIYGFLFWTGLKLIMGKGRQVSCYMYGLSAFCLIFLFFNYTGF